MIKYLVELCTEIKVTNLSSSETQLFITTNTLIKIF